MTTTSAEQARVRLYVRFAAATLGILTVNIPFILILLWIFTPLGFVKCLLGSLVAILVGGIQLVAATMDYTQKAKEEHEAKEEKKD